MRTQSKCLTAILGLTLLSGLGCKKGPTVGPDTAAIVNQTEIRSADVERVYQNRVKTAGQPQSQEEVSTLKLNILSQLINDEILMQRAAKDNLTATEPEVTSNDGPFMPYWLFGTTRTFPVVAFCGTQTWI